ncbi:MAG: MFS transporter [Clostridia bacterium]|nr:MFS transporter [Clostridia bacterium]
MNSVKKLTAHYSVIQFIHNCTLCSVLAFSTPFLQDRGFTNSQIGTVLSLASLISIVLNPLLASFSDRHSELPIKTIASILLGISAVGSGLLIFLPSLFIPTAIISGVLYLLSRVQGTFLVSLAMDHVYSGVDLNFSLARGFGSVGYAAMAYFMGYAVDFMGTKVIMLVILVGALIDVFAIMLFPQVEAKAQKDSKDDENQETIGLFEFMKRNPRFMLVVIAVVLVYVSHTFINTYTINVVESIGGTSKEMGIGTAIAALVELHGMAIVPWMRKKFGNAGALLKLAAITFMVKSIITILAPNIFVFYIAQLTQFFGFATIIPAGVFFVNENVSKANKVKGQSVFDMGLIISGIISNKVGGMLFDATNVRTTLFIGTIITAVGTVMLFLVLAGRKKNKV